MANTKNRPPDFKSEQALGAIGRHITTWRRIHGWTQDLVAQRAGVSRGAVVRLENGHPGVSLDVFVRVLSVLKSLDPMLEGVDPFSTEFGRLRADMALRERVISPTKRSQRGAKK